MDKAFNPITRMTVLFSSPAAWRHPGEQVTGSFSVVLQPTRCVWVDVLPHAHDVIAVEA